MIARLSCLILIASLVVACGKKGPPLAPLHLVPAVVADVVARRTGDDVRLRFALPTANMNGPGRIQLDRVEIYAVTVAPDAAAPADRNLLSAAYRVATLPVKPAPVEGEPPPAADAADTRPSPGGVVNFAETLTPDKLMPAKLPLLPPTSPRVAPVMVAPPATPSPVTPPPVTTAPPATTPPVTTPPATTPPVTTAPPATTPPVSTPPATVPPAATAPLPATSPTVVSPEEVAAGAAPVALNVAPLLTLPGPVQAYPVRIYVIRGMTKSGRGGEPSARVQVPLVAPPAPPMDLKATYTETALALAWTALPQIPPPAFNVYLPDAATPINAAPLTAPAFELAGMEFGTERCFVVRTVETVAGIQIESGAPSPVCVTPKDIFPPAAPERLQVVPAPGTMNLSWQPNTEADLAGYIVLRGDVPGDTLQALTPEPITTTRFEDKTARPGARYVYVVVAVDRATPRNTSAHSNRVEETAR